MLQYDMMFSKAILHKLVNQVRALCRQPRDQGSGSAIKSKQWNDTHGCNGRNVMEVRIRPWSRAGNGIGFILE